MYDMDLLPICFQQFPHHSDITDEEVSILDISSLSIALNQSILNQNVSLAVTKLALNSAQQSGAQLVETLQATDPNLGNIIDLEA
jgi:hypothetical protein